MNDDDNDSPPPPPPGSPPPLAAIKLYPGYTHYSYTAPGTAVIYTQQPQQAYGMCSVYKLVVIELLRSWLFIYNCDAFDLSHFPFIEDIHSSIDGIHFFHHNC